MPTLKLIVRNFTERADERRLERAVRALKGVYGVVANCEGHCLEIDFEDDDVSIHQIVGAVRDAGFEARLAS
jgi:copper chaperone CopZ